MTNKMKMIVPLLLFTFAGCGSNGDISPWALQTLQIEPSRAVIQPGGHQKFIAVMKDAAGKEVSDASFEWSISDSDVAILEVDARDQGVAFVSGTKTGTVEVKIISNGISTTRVLTVNASASRPVEISRVFPEEGSVISDRRPEIGVDVSYRRCACGDDTIDTIRLFLDATEVTEQASWSGTLDIPQTGVEIVHLPSPSLSQGTHTVEARITSKLERSSTYSWSFRIE